MEWEWRWNEKFHCQKQGYSNCSSWQPFVCFLFGKKHHGHCLGLAFRWEPMVIDLVQPSAGNAICVMGFNFLETDHPWFLTVTTSLVGWISGLGEPNPRPASLCGTLLAPPLWVSTLHQFGQVNGGWWAWPVERHGSAILVYSSLAGSSLMGFFILAPQHLAHGGLIEAGGCEWLGLVFLEIKIVGKCRSCLIEPYVVKNRTHWNAKKCYGKLHATFTWQRTWFLYSCLSLCIAIWQKKAANQ